MELVTSIILIVFAVLQIILFFKIWGMTNDVSQIKEKLTVKVVENKDWKKEFTFNLSIDQKGKAKEILYAVIYDSDEFRKLISGNQEYHDRFIKELNDKFMPFMNAIGEDSFKFNETIYRLNS